jgi:hypothetical protein
LNGIGRPCFIFQPKGDLDKRQASIQLCIRAEGEQLVRVGIIFRGRGEQVKAGERAMYGLLKPFICVYFQPKAWCDGHVARAWLEQFQQETGHLGERMLGMDGHLPQCTQACKDIMAAYDIIPAVSPPGCTDVVSPCDHHVGARIKNIMSHFYHADVREHRAAWCMPPGLGGLSAWQRRAKMALWLAAAWVVIRDDAPFLRAAFVSTGFLIAQNGSENHLIKIPTAPSYDFTL